MDDRQDSLIDQTGYGDKPKPDDELAQLWILEQIPKGIHTNILGVLKCNSQARGFIQFQNEEEFKWLKRRIDGERRL